MHSHRGRWTNEKKFKFRQHLNAERFDMIVKYIEEKGRI